MTVIAVKKLKNKFEIAGDTQTTRGFYKFPSYDKSDDQIKAYGKIVQVNGMTLACAGKTSQIGLAYIFCKTTTPKDMEKDSVLDWLVELKEYVSKKSKIGFNEVKIDGIMIKDGKCFAFYNFLQVLEVNSFHAIGSGGFIAMATLEVGVSVMEAVKVAIKYDTYCSGEPTKIEIPIT